MRTGGCETKVERAHLYQQYGLFAVFDGHNGQMSSDALHSGLHVAVGKQPIFHQAPDKVRSCPKSTMFVVGGRTTARRCVMSSGYWSLRFC